MQRWVLLNGVRAEHYISCGSFTTVLPMHPWKLAPDEESRSATSLPTLIHKKMSTTEHLRSFLDDYWIDLTVPFGQFLPCVQHSLRLGCLGAKNSNKSILWCNRTLIHGTRLGFDGQRSKIAVNDIRGCSRKTRYRQNTDGRGHQRPYNHPFQPSGSCKTPSVEHNKRRPAFSREEQDHKQAAWKVC